MANIQHNQRVVTASVIGYMEDNQLKPIPDQSIIVFNPELQPLMAVKHEADRGGIPFDVMVLEGIGKAFELGNLPNFTSTFTNGNSTMTQSSGDNNLLSGFIEGALNPLREELKRQAQQPKSPSFWYLPAETEVLLFVQVPVKL